MQRRAEVGYEVGLEMSQLISGIEHRDADAGAKPRAIRHIYGVGELAVVAVAVTVGVGGSPRISKRVETCQVVPMKI